MMTTVFLIVSNYPVQGLAMVNSDRLIGDVIGVVIEKVLM